MCGVKLRSVQCAKDLCVKIAYNLKLSQPCNDAANKANGVLGFIKRNFSFKNKDIINTLSAGVHNSGQPQRGLIAQVSTIVDVAFF